MHWQGVIHHIRNTFNTISKLTIFLSVASLLMNFSTAAVISSSLRIFENLDGLLMVKALSRSLGYAGQFVVGFLTEIFHCNKLILRIGYGSNFVIKPMFFIACIGLSNIFDFLGIHVKYDTSTLKFIDMIIFILADILDQFCNNFRDVARDTLIASSVNISYLSKNLFFRKSCSFLGTGIGGLFALICGIYWPTNGIYLIVLCVSISSIVGYILLNMGLNINCDIYAAEKFQDWKSLKDVRFTGFIIFSVGLWACLFKIKYLMLYFVIGGMFLLILFIIKRKEIGMPLMSNKVFISSGIFTCFFMMFRFNQYGLLKAFDTDSIFAIISNTDTHIQKQIFFLMYYIISFCSSFTGSMLVIRNMSSAVIVCSASLLITHLLAFLSNNNPYFFLLSMIFYSINVGLYEPLMNAGIVKHSRNFIYKGITLGLFSIFNSIGISLNIYLIGAFSSNFETYLSICFGFYAIIVIFWIISRYSNNNKFLGIIE